MGKKKVVCGVCGNKIEFAHTQVVYNGKIIKVCSETCFKKALKNEENINGRGVNRSIGFYNRR